MCMKIGNLTLSNVNKVKEHLFHLFQKIVSTFEKVPNIILCSLKNHELKIHDFTSASTVPVFGLCGLWKAKPVFQNLIYLTVNFLNLKLWYYYNYYIDKLNYI